MHLLVAVELVVELVPQLRQEARLDQGRWRRIDTGFTLHALLALVSLALSLLSRGEGEGEGEVTTYLASREVHGHDAEVLRVRQELGVHHGCVHLGFGLERLDRVMQGVFVRRDDV